VSKINKWSKNFHERSHCTSCRYWRLNQIPFCCVHRSRHPQCYSMDRTIPKNRTFSCGISTPSNTWFIGPTHTSQSLDVTVNSLNQTAKYYGTVGQLLQLRCRTPISLLISLFMAKRSPWNAECRELVAGSQTGRRVVREIATSNSV